MTGETQTVVDEQNPWPGLDAFGESAQRFFNGRENEAAALRRLVLNAPLTVLFSASGLGKTSLIQAGLFPLLRKENCLPIRIRLDCRDRSAPLIDQIKQSLKDQFSALHVDAPPLNGNGTLWQYLHRDGLEIWSQRNQLLIPVFVLDQFEEVFTLGAENLAAVNQLLIDVADLVENRIPTTLANALKGDERASSGLSFESQHYRVVLSFREDFLPYVEGWKRQMPSILRNRLRLLPMTGERAFKAVHDTAPQFVDETLAWKIVHFVAAAQDNGSGSHVSLTDAAQELSIEPALLSLVCEGLNQKRKAQNKSSFDDALLTGTGQSIVADFYERQVSDLPDNVQRFIENELITERGFRKPCDVDDAQTIHGVTREELGVLENRRILRIEPQHGTDRIELIHDLLTGVVRQHRERRRSKEKTEKRRREQRQKQRALLTIGAIILLAILSAAGISLGVLARRAQRDAERAQIAEAEVAKQSQQAASKALQENDRFKELDKAAARRQEGFYLLREQKYDAALQAFKSALGTYQQQNARKTDQISTLIDIGDILALVLNFDEAENAYKQAQEISTAEADQTLKGKVLESLASLKERQSRLQEALKYYVEANSVYQKVGDARGSGRVLERLAYEAEQTHAPEKAINYYQGALKAYNFAGDELGKKRVQQALSRLLGYWGFLLDLGSGQVHQLNSDTVNIGRDVPGVKNDISFPGPGNLVSRRHLAISRDMRIDDMRSRNGTTLNARVLPYGIGAKLSDHDVIVLANVVPLQFWLTKPPASFAIPKDAWAVSVEGESKGYRYLTGQEYSWTIEDGKLVFHTGFSNSAVLRLRRVNDTPQMMIVNNQWKVASTIKETDYEYKTYAINAGEWLDHPDGPLRFVKLSPDEKSISEEGPAIQFVLLNAPVQ
jgi:tetratricopeptide (TPR) repeat protein